MLSYIHSTLCTFKYTHYYILQKPQIMCLYCEHKSKCLLDQCTPTNLHTGCVTDFAFFIQVN